MMINKYDLQKYIVRVLKKEKGKCHFIVIAKWIWDNKKEELEASGIFFYKWQYEMRWAGDTLVKKEIIIKATKPRTGIWTLIK